MSPWRDALPWALAWFTLAWVVHFPLRNAAVVDVAWSYALPLLAGVEANAAGWPQRVTPLVAMVCVWGLRLGTWLWFLRVGRPGAWHAEEGRYQELRRHWGGAFWWKVYLFFLAQAGLALALTLPVLLVAQDPGPVTAWHGLATLLWLAALLGEAGSDWQLYRFKVTHPGQVCDSGWWRYSRHPNYFFESMVWLAYALYAWPSPHGGWAMACWATMLFFLVKVSGVPTSEAQSLRSRGDAYRRYQKTTSVFIPWFRKDPP